ncbi:SMAD/FHA domain-containing protein, partial [Amanita rubescens]
LPVPGSSLTPANPSANSGAGATPTNATFRIRLVPHLDSRRSLRFDAITRDLREIDPALRIGRFTDRSGMGLAAVNALGTNKLAFKSKVVSRAHAEIWVEKGGKFLIKDTKSSSGTFLNHIRLSPANQESRPFPLKDGDILQLGVDYQGGAEDIYKSVKIRVEIGREWQASANAFNTTALKNLKNLAAVVGPAAPLAIPGASVKGNTVKPAKLQIPDCCICLFAVSIRQALFIAPCSHTFHYKCIKPLLEAHHPAFSCPLCRTYADLEEDVEVEPTDLDEDADADVEID